MIAAAQIVESEGYAIDHAWRDLSRNAFAVWIRLMLEPRRSLSLGIKPLARRLAVDHKQLSSYLKELRNKGYLRIIKGAHPSPASIVIVRRAMLVGLTQFITL
jgi:hypothetical protein